MTHQRTSYPVHEKAVITRAEWETVQTKTEELAPVAANADTSGATLAQLETEVNELKAALRTLGLMAT